MFELNELIKSAAPVVTNPFILGGVSLVSGVVAYNTGRFRRYLQTKINTAMPGFHGALVEYEVKHNEGGYKDHVFHSHLVESSQGMIRLMGGKLYSNDLTVSEKKKNRRFVVSLTVERGVNFLEYNEGYTEHFVNWVISNRNTPVSQASGIREKLNIFRSAELVGDCLPLDWDKKGTLLLTQDADFKPTSAVLSLYLSLNADRGNYRCKHKGMKKTPVKVSYEVRYGDEVVAKGKWFGDYDQEDFKDVIDKVEVCNTYCLQQAAVKGVFGENQVVPKSLSQYRFMHSANEPIEVKSEVVVPEVVNGGFGQGDDGFKQVKNEPATPAREQVHFDDHSHGRVMQHNIAEPKVVGQAQFKPTTVTPAKPFWEVMRLERNLLLKEFAIIAVDALKISDMYDAQSVKEIKYHYATYRKTYADNRAIDIRASIEEAERVQRLQPVKAEEDVLELDSQKPVKFPTPPVIVRQARRTDPFPVNAVGNA